MEDKFSLGPPVKRRVRGRLGTRQKTPPIFGLPDFASHFDSNMLTGYGTRSDGAVLLNISGNDSQALGTFAGRDRGMI